MYEPSLAFWQGLASVVITLFALDQNMPLAYFKLYRRLRGGRWNKVFSVLPLVPFMWHRTKTPNSEYQEHEEPNTKHED